MPTPMKIRKFASSMSYLVFGNYLTSPFFRASIKTINTFICPLYQKVIDSTWWSTSEVFARNLRITGRRRTAACSINSMIVLRSAIRIEIITITIDVADPPGCRGNGKKNDCSHASGLSEGYVVTSVPFDARPNGVLARPNSRRIAQDIGPVWTV